MAKEEDSRMILVLVHALSVPLIDPTKPWTMNRTKKQKESESLVSVVLDRTLHRGLVCRALLLSLVIATHFNL